MSDIPVSSLTLICVGSSFAFSGLFYHLYREKKKELQKLEEIPKFNPTEDFLRLVKATPLKRLQYVSIEGLVLPDDKPLASQYVPQCFGVIQKVVLQEHWKVWNSIARVWNLRKINRRETINSVPFSLVTPGAYASEVSVKVDSPLLATGGFLQQVHRRLCKAPVGLLDLLEQELTGEKTMALEESEAMLRVGATLTGFGEVVLEEGRVLRLRPPLDGREYILVPTDHQSFLHAHQCSAAMWKLLAALCGATGAALLTEAIYRGSKGQDRTRKGN